MTTVVAAPSAPATVYAVSYRGRGEVARLGEHRLWKSVDRGAHWRLLGTTGGNLAVATSDANTVYDYGGGCP